MKNRFLIIILIIMFVILGLLSIKGYTQNIDNSVYNFLINFKCENLTNFFKFISFLFSSLMIIIYCVLILLFSNNRENSITLCFIMIFEALINNVIKIVFKRPRPNVLALVYEKTYSFSSGHTMAAIFLLLILGYFLKKDKSKIKKNVITTIQFSGILAVAVSRIYLGAHYFTDIIGAILLSCIILLIIKNSKNFSIFLNGCGKL